MTNPDEPEDEKTGSQNLDGSRMDQARPRKAAEPSGIFPPSRLPVNPRKRSLLFVQESAG